MIITERVGNTRLENVIAGDEMEDVSDFQVRNGGRGHFFVWVVDIGGHLGAVHHDFRLLRHIDGDDAAVRLVDFRGKDLCLAVAFIEPQRNGAVVVLASFRQDLECLVIECDGRAIRLVGGEDIVVDECVIRVWIFFFCNVLRHFEHFLYVQEGRNLLGMEDGGAGGDEQYENIDIFTHDSS